MKKLAALSLRLPNDLLALIDSRVGKRGRSEYIRAAIETHTALLDLVAVLARRQAARQSTEHEEAR